MGHQIHIFRVEAADTQAALDLTYKNASSMMVEKGAPRTVGYLNTATGEADFFFDYFDRPLGEEDILHMARLLRFSSVYADVPKEVAPWRTTTLADPDEDPEYLAWKEKQVDNERESERFATETLSMAEERRFAMPLVKRWIKAVDDNEEYVISNSPLKHVVEQIAGTQMSPHYPFTYGRNMFASYCHAIAHYRHRGQVVYVLVSMHH